jgi:hypothetical protein
MVGIFECEFLRPSLVAHSDLTLSSGVFYFLESILSSFEISSWVICTAHKHMQWA